MRLSFRKVTNITPWIVGVLFLALSGCGGSSPAASGATNSFTSHTNIAYASVSPTETLDLFVPSGAGPYPLVIFIHGGAFVSGSKANLDSTLQQAFLNGGMAIASINYRLIQEAFFPAATQDAKAAVRFLRANALQFNLASDRFLVFGESAGANLGDLIGTTGDNTTFDDSALGNAGVSSRVQGVIDWSGPTDFVQLDTQELAQGCVIDSNSASSWLLPYLGINPSLVPNLVKQTNPINFIAAGDPPFLIQHGDQDCVVPFMQSELLKNALAAAGDRVTFDTLTGAGHLTPAYFESSANVARIVSFAKSVLQ